MKITKYLATGLLAAASLLATSCVDDLNVTPNDPNTKTEPDSKEDMVSLFAYLYFDLLTGDGLNVSDGGAGSFTRCHFNLQEIVADEFFISDKWNDPGYTVLNFNTWAGDNEWIYAAYSRENHIVKVASDFISKIHEYGPRFGFTDAEISAMDAEARFLRGLGYYYTIDLFGRGPWVTEESVTGAVPPTYDRTQLFEATVADLTQYVENLIPAAQQSYGRLSREAGYMLLAKLYLNAEVYTGTPMYDKCADALSHVVGTGLQLADEYKYLFCASNDKYVACNTNPNGEIIWAVPQKVGETETWGGTTYLTVGAWMEAEDDDKALQQKLTELNNYGTPWSGLRCRPELSKALKSDSRRLIYEGSFQEEIPDLAGYDKNSCGYMLIKYTNTTEDDYFNEAGEQNNSSQVSSADYPIFRLADAYLMLAECQLHGVNCNGYEYFNLVRDRAHMDRITTPSASDILKERMCELYAEGHRRSDLVRFNRYTGSTYLWSWKGGEETGTSIADYRSVFCIPTQYVETIGQNAGY